jgi:hypothetical protein
MIEQTRHAEKNEQEQQQGSFPILQSSAAFLMSVKHLSPWPPSVKHKLGDLLDDFLWLTISL